MNAAALHKDTVKFNAQNLSADCKCMLFMNKKIILKSMQGLKN